MQIMQHKHLFATTLKDFAQRSSYSFIFYIHELSEKQDYDSIRDPMYIPNLITKIQFVFFQLSLRFSITDLAEGELVFLFVCFFGLVMMMLQQQLVHLCSAALLGLV